MPTTKGPTKPTEPVMTTAATPAPTTKRPVGPCPVPDWPHRGSNCFLFNVTDPVEWPIAEFVCELVGGHLTSIESSSDNSWVLNRLAGTDSYLPRVWIGLLKNINSKLLTI